MPAELVAIADDVVAVINAATLSLARTAVRLYILQFELKDMGTLHVSVVPRTKTSTPLTRKSNTDVYTVDIGVQKRFTAIEPAAINAAVDPLVAFVDELVVLFDKKRLPAVPAAICTARKPDPIYSDEHMERLRQFTSVVTLTFTEHGVATA